MSTTPIFAVEKGSYSDYRVIGVFSTREAAEKLAAWTNAGASRMDVAEVAEWVLDPPCERMNAGLTLWAIDMHRDGRVESGFELSRGIDDDYREEQRLKDDWAPSLASAGQWVPMVKTGKRRLYAAVLATDKDHAIKIVNERRGQMIAMGEWEDAS